MPQTRKTYLLEFEMPVSEAGASERLDYVYACTLATSEEIALGQARRYLQLHALEPGKLISCRSIEDGEHRVLVPLEADLISMARARTAGTAILVRRSMQL